MAVPKKRTSKAKRNSRKANWKRKAAKITKGSSTPNQVNVGSITKAQLEEIALVWFWSTHYKMDGILLE